MTEILSNCEQFEEICMEFDDKIAIKIDDPTFSRSILKKAYESEWLVDVTLITEADSTRIVAHRIVLAAATEYFSAMFTTSMMEKNQKEIKIKEVSGESLKSLVSYCYTGQIEINSYNVVDLLASASMMRFEKIEVECRNFLEKQLKADPKFNFNICLIAQRYSFTELAKNSLRNICENFDILSKTSEFNEIDFSFMEQILDSDERFNATEEEVFEAAMRWVDFDRNERQQFTPNILKLIRLTQIHPTYLIEKVQPICESNNCTRLVTNALYWKAMPEQERLVLFPVKQTTKRTGSLEMLVVGMNTPSDVISMESYCTRTKKWISCPEIKISVTSGARLAVIGEFVYVTGETVFCFNLRTLKLSQLPSMLIPRESHSVAAISSGLYVIGGYNTKCHRISSAERYDLNKNEWKSCKEMRSKRSEYVVVFLNDYLYVIGGYDDNVFLNSVERYSLSSDTWSSVKCMNERRVNAGVGVLNGKIYVIGGWADLLFLESVEFYDPNTDIWTTIASLSTPRHGLVVAVYENEIFAIGGKNSTAVERYNVNENKWITIEPLKCLRSVSRVAIIQRD